MNPKLLVRAQRFFNSNIAPSTGRLKSCSRVADELLKAYQLVTAGKRSPEQLCPLLKKHEALEQIATNSMKEFILPKRLERGRSGLTPSDWKEFFRTYSYGDCIHTTSFVQASLDEENHTLGNSAICVLSTKKSVLLQWLLIQYAPLITLKFKGLATFDEATHQKIRSDTFNNLGAHHVFNVVGLREDIRSAVFNSPEGSFRLSGQLEELAGSTIIDGWLTENNVFEGSRAGEIYNRGSHFLVSTNNLHCSVLNPKSARASLILM